MWTGALASLALNADQKAGAQCRAESPERTAEIIHTLTYTALARGAIPRKITGSGIGMRPPQSELIPETIIDQLTECAIGVCTDEPPYDVARTINVPSDEYSGSNAESLRERSGLPGIVVGRDVVGRSEGSPNCKKIGQGNAAHDPLLLWCPFEVTGS